ncbi:MAG: TonB-dependent receptor, partial [Cyclobacteriaceae bacterium]|nr:TonB-dependent receptor [Cyclobacteriaceae bacterium]
VVNSNDNGNEIIVRGNTPRGILWKLDGVEIPSPNHFSTEGASSGGISMFSTQVVSRSDFFTGAFAPQYGNATSGVFDIRLRRGNNEKPERTVQLGFLGADVSAEGPFTKGKRGSYLFNYRYSTLGILTKLGLQILNDGESNIFQDLSLKLNFPTRVLGTFSIFGLGGASSQKRNSTDMIDVENYNMGVVGLSHQFSLGSSAFLRSTLSVSGTGVIGDAEQTFGVSSIKSNKKFEKSFYRASLLLNKKINAHHVIEAGGTITRLNFNYSNKLTNPLGNPPLNKFEILGDAGSSSTIQTYFSWKYRVSNSLSLVNGFHFFRFDLTGESSVEPRSSLKWQFTSKNSFSLGYGLHSRMESLEYYLGKYFNPDLSSVSYNRHLGLTKSNHYVLGFDRQINESLYFKSEIYYQHLFNVPIAADKSFPFSTINVTEGYSPIKLINQGTGPNYGIELTLERKFTNQFYYMMNASIYESTYKAADGIERNSRFNGNFSLNFLAGKEFNVGINGKNNIFGINTKVGYAGNKRYTPIDLVASRQANSEVRSSTEIYAKRYPDHFRIDLQLSYRRNKGKHTSEWRLDVQNLTNRGNVLNDFYENGAILQSKGLKLIPVLSYRIEF